MSNTDQAANNLTQCVQSLKTQRLDCRVRLTDRVTSAVWCWNKRTRKAEILVNRQLCLELPPDQLQVLVVHELLHHTGYNDHWNSFPSNASHNARNISLDIALECWMNEFDEWAGPLRQLNDRLLVATIPKRPRVLKGLRAVSLLVHSAPPLARMPKRVRGVWQFIWTSPVRLSAIEVYQQVAPLLDSRASGKRPDTDTPPRSVANHLAPLEIESEGGTTEQLFPRFIPPGESDDPSGESDDEKRRVVPAVRRSARSTNGRRDSDSLAGIVPGFATLGEMRHAGPTPAIAEEKLSRFARWLKAQYSRNSTSSGTARRRRKTVVSRRPYLYRPTQAELRRRACGIPTLLYSNRITTDQWNHPLAVYLDTSGSMHCQLPEIVAIIRSIQGLLPAKLFSFDTEVLTLDTTAVAAGEIYFGGGTDFDCFVCHAVNNQIQDAIVMTDGLSWVADALLSKARERNIDFRAVVFGDPFDDQEWFQSAFHWTD